MKKILIFSTAYLPFIGGAEIAIKEITERITDIEWHLITPRYRRTLAEREVIGNVTIHRVGSGRFYDKHFFPISGRKKGLILHAKEQFDALWSVEETRAGYAALTLAEKISKPYLLTLQSGSSEKDIQRKTWFWKSTYKNIYQKAAHIQVISTFLKERAIRYGFQGDISIIPNGVTLAQFQITLASADLTALKRQLGLDQTMPTVITVSRLESKNGIADLIDAIVVLNRTYNRKVNLLIVGEGSLEKSLCKKVTDYKLSEQVVFTRSIQHNKLAPYLKLADIFCRPSLSEGLGIAFLEAMAAGVPIIATPVGGIPDFLVNKKTGLFCKVRNANSIAHKIDLYLSDRALYADIKHRAQTLIAEKYNWDSIAQRIGRIFSNLK